MPLKDLGEGIASRRVVGAPLEETFHRAHAALRDFKKRGMDVAFLEEDFPLALLAEVSDAGGTRIIASVELLPDGDNTELTLALAGQVFLGGLEGALATPTRVRLEAMKRAEALLDARFSDLPPRPRRFVPKARASLDGHAAEASVDEGSVLESSAAETSVAEASTDETAHDGAAAEPAETTSRSVPPDDARRRQVEEAFHAGLLSEEERDALLSRL